MALILGSITSLLSATGKYSSRDIYVLRLYDEDLLKFRMWYSEGLEGIRTQIVSINRKSKNKLPPDMELTDDGVLMWLKRRVIPKNRAFVEKILSTMGLRAGDTKGIIDVCKGLSLNDSYWVVPDGFDGSFAEYNLYENRFSEILSLVAYTGGGHSGEVFRTSPEFTTHGMLRKAWHYIENDGIYLYKGGTEGALNAGLEPYSEYYASQIAECMGLKAVHYDLEKWKGVLASKCKLFTDINTAYIPIGHLVKTGGLQACIDYYAGLGEEALEDIKSMLVFDAVIYNEDRHYGNFGVLMDSRTCRINGAAPIFDNGVSLFNYAMPDEYKNLTEYAKTRSNPYGIPYEMICQAVMGTKQRRELKKLIGFSFKKHEQYNLPNKRLKAIERHINARVRDLLSLPKGS